MDYVAFKVIRWYLRSGDDWEYDESLIIGDDTLTKFHTATVRPFGTMTSSREISVCRGKLDFTPDLVSIKKEWPGLYDWLVKEYEEPERMRFVK